MLTLRKVGCLLLSDYFLFTNKINFILFKAFLNQLICNATKILKNLASGLFFLAYEKLSTLSQRHIQHDISNVSVRCVCAHVCEGGERYL